jgi:hypothetical protein
MLCLAAGEVKARLALVFTAGSFAVIAAEHRSRSACLTGGSLFCACATAGRQDEATRNGTAWVRPTHLAAPER